MKRPAIPIIVVLAAALVGLLVYGVVQRGDDTTLDSAVARGEQPVAPGASVRLPTLDGRQTRSLADLRGKIVVLNFWASWCDPCAEESPILEQAQRRLAASGGTVLGVTYRDDAGDSRDFVAKHKLSFPSLRDDKLDLAPKYGTTKLPETFVLDRRGNVVAISRGQLERAFLDRAIDRAEAAG